MKHAVKKTLLLCVVLIVGVLMFVSCNVNDILANLNQSTSSNNEQSMPTDAQQGGKLPSSNETYPSIDNPGNTIPDASCEHSLRVLDAVDPTCAQTGLTAGAECIYCGKVIVEQKVIPMIDHDIIIEEAVEPTCTETGLTEGKHCSICNEVFVVQDIIPKNEHNYISAFVAPTAKENGGTRYTCSKCGDSYITDVIVPTDFTITKENVLDMLDYTDGWENFDIPAVFQKDSTWYRVTSIGDSAFAGRYYLTSITIPDSVTSIGKSAFAHCSLRSVTIPDSVTSIAERTFSYCDCLESITIPDSITAIGEDAFLRCPRLISITIPESVTSIGEDAFLRCDSFESITVANGNSVYYSEGNCLIERESKTLIKGCNNSIIPQNITAICDYAFFMCDDLSIIIPNGVTSIGDYAFGDCYNLTDITIPDSVTSIGNSVFHGCSRLENIIVAKDNPVYYSEGNCIIERESKILISGCKNSIIPQDIIAIGDNAFSVCYNLTSITIPDSVTSIGDYAFAGADDLKSITFEGTVAQWNAIPRGENWNYNVPATWVICSNGSVRLK